jgi:dipeptidyl aminopeptidase/acylaminoacyl peptidase
MRGLVAIACAGVLCAACSSAGHPRPQRAEKVAFVSGQDGYVYSADPSGRLPLRRLTKGRDWGAQALTWSPDGRRLAIVQTRESSRVVVMNANGRHRRRLSRVDSELAQLRWTRPGTIDVSVPEDGGRESLFHLGVSNGKISYVREARPGALSPDGSEHAFVDRKGLRLFVARGEERPVEIRPFRGTGPSPVFLGSPSWSPNETGRGWRSCSTAAADGNCG